MAAVPQAACGGAAARCRGACSRTVSSDRGSGLVAAAARGGGGTVAGARGACMTTIPAAGVAG